MEVEGAGEHEAALGTALLLHLHQLADVRLEIPIRRILFLTISEQYFLTSSNTGSLTAFSDSVMESTGIPKDWMKETSCSWSRSRSVGSTSTDADE